MNPSTPRRRVLSRFDAVACAAVLAVGLAAYSNSFHGPFVLDDLDEITENQFIRVESLSPTSLWTAAWQSPSARRPVANLSLAVNYYFGGYDVRGYHATNLAIHLACGLLVYFFAKVTFAQLSPAETPAAPTAMAIIAALAFVAHPVQTQAVTYVVQRMTCLCVLFYVAAMLCYVQGREEDVKQRRWWWWSGTAICGLVALGTKEIAAVLPLAMLAYEWYFFRDLDSTWIRRVLVVVLPVVGLLAAIVVLTPSLREEFIGGYAYRTWGLRERLLTEARALFYYLSLVLWPLPSRLSITHDMSVSQGLLQPWTTLTSLVGIVCLVVVAVATVKRYRIVSFGIVWFLLHLMIESTVLPLELVFEHRLYLPMVGLMMIVAWTLCAVVREQRWRVAVAATGVFLLALATHERNKVWQDDFVLWTDVVAKYPSDGRAHNNLGISLDARGETIEAAEAYSKAIAVLPEYADAINNLGASLAELGEANDAIALYKRAIELDPNHAEAHYNLGTAEQKQGNNKAAISEFRRAIELRPEFVAAHNNLGSLLDTQGELGEAISHYQRALAYEPANADVLNNLGVSFAKQGKLGEATAFLRKSLDVSPNDAETHFNLGNVLALQGNRLVSQTHFRRAVELATAEGDQSLVDAATARLESGR